MNSLLGHIQQDLQEFTARVKRDLGDDYTDEERNKRFKLSVNDAIEEYLKKERQTSSGCVSDNALKRSSVSEPYETIPVKSGSAPCNHPVCRNQAVCSLPKAETEVPVVNTTPTYRPIATPISPSELLKYSRRSSSQNEKSPQTQPNGNNTINPLALSNFRPNGFSAEGGAVGWSPELSFEKKSHIQGAIPRRAFPLNAPSGISLQMRNMAVGNGNTRIPNGFVPFIRRPTSESKILAQSNGLVPQRAATKSGITNASAAPSFSGSSTKPVSVPAVPAPMDWDMAETFKPSQQKPSELAPQQRKPTSSSEGSGQVTPTTTESSASQPQMSNVGSQNSTSRGVLITPATRSQPRRYRRVFCTACQKHPEGFRGAHELERHNQREHGTCKVVWYTIDISDDQQFLAACKNCRQKKIYNTDYNAAAHLRRYHFNKKLKTDSKEEKERKSNSDLPPMEVVRGWMKRCRIDKSKLKDQKFLINQEEDVIVPDLEEDAIFDEKVQDDINDISAERSSSLSSGTMGEEEDDSDNDNDNEEQEFQDVTGYFPQDLELENQELNTSQNNYILEDATFPMDNSQGFEDFNFFPPMEDSIFRDHMQQMGIDESRLMGISTSSTDPDGFLGSVSFGTTAFDGFEFPESLESQAMTLSQELISSASLDLDMKTQWSIN